MRKPKPPCTPAVMRIRVRKRFAPGYDAYMSRVDSFRDIMTPTNRPLLCLEYLQSLWEFDENKNFDICVTKDKRLANRQAVEFLRNGKNLDYKVWDEASQRYNETGSLTWPSAQQWMDRRNINSFDTFYAWIEY